MGGRDKAFLTLAGRPLLAHAIEALRPQVSELLISSNRPPHLFAPFDLPVIADPLPHGPGPLAGLLAGLTSATTDWVVSVPCDMPRLPPDLVARLLEAALRKDAPAAIPSDGEHTHFALALVHRSRREALENHLRAGGRRVGDWLREQKAAVADFSDAADCFINANTPADLRALEARFGAVRPLPPLFGFAAWSGTGKTTLLERLIPELTGRGLRVGLIKHAHHDFDIDIPGKDSYRLRKAGAEQVVVASGRRLAMVVEQPAAADEDPSLADLLDLIDPSRIDLLLVEGFRHEPALPKIELHRMSLGKPLLCAGDPSVMAVACDEPVQLPPGLPLLDLNSPQAIADFICGRLFPSG